MQPVVWLLAGPNGSGKSTFYQQVLSKAVPDFVNADVIAAAMGAGDPEAIAWEAARQADRERTRMLSTGRSFATETVFSHSSKIDFVTEARAAGYMVKLVFICLEDPRLNILRVAHRVTRGGHDVPLDRIASRYARALENVAAARTVADELLLYDNSFAGKRHRRVARFVGGELVSLRPPIPNWLRGTFGAEIDAFLKRGA